MPTGRFSLADVMTPPPAVPAQSRYSGGISAWTSSSLTPLRARRIQDRGDTRDRYHGYPQHPGLGVWPVSMPSAPLLGRPRRGEPDQIMGPYNLPALRAPRWLELASRALSGAYAPSCRSVAAQPTSSPLPHLNGGGEPQSSIGMRICQDPERPLNTAPASTADND